MIGCKELVFVTTLSYQIVYLGEKCCSQSRYSVSQKGTKLQHEVFPLLAFALLMICHLMSYAMLLSRSSQRYVETTVLCAWFWFLKECLWLLNLAFKSFCHADVST